ncbi:MAG TPA: patatin-like phospholipase family protein [Nitrososphaera sp.]|nr:patatin-like phospholipase family protein [Nitrososphaera sp.]
MTQDMKSKPENVLILQGGGSLGAFACGVYKALAKSKGCGKIDVVAGTSIGGVNAAIIAGCVNDQPEEALEQFWLELAENSSLRGFSVPQLFQAQAMESWSRNNFGSEFDAHVNSIGSFYQSATMGNPKMFVPRWLLSNASKDDSFFAPHKWTYVYDHSPLAKTLERYVDYSKLHPKGNPHARLIITAVNVLTAEPLTFDSAQQQISPRHVLATSAYPLYFFPWVEVEEGVYCWDGGLLSNTPLREVIDASPVADKKIFIVENYPKNIQELPQNLAEVLHRARDIIFSDKTLHNVKMMKVITSYLRFIDELYNALEKADPSKVDPATRKKLERKYRKFKVERGAEILGIRYITREEKHPHVYENADFSIDTIKSSILEGETRTREVLERMNEL